MIRELDSASIPGFDALRTRRQWLAFGLLAVSATVVAQLCDQLAWQHMRDLRIYDKDFGRLLRLIGYLPTWLIVAGALWLQNVLSGAWVLDWRAREPAHNRTIAP